MIPQFQLSEEQRSALSTYQTSVVKHASSKDSEERDALQKVLEENLSNIKSIAVSCDSKRAK